MSETQNTPQEESQAFNITNVFNKQPEVPMDESKETPKKEQPKKVNAPKKETAKPEKEEVEEEEDLDDEPESKEASKANEIDYKAEWEKSQKIIKDTQKSYHENNKRIAGYKKAIEKMKEEGTLLDEEATNLLDYTKYDEIPEDEPLIVKYGKIWDKEIEYMKKYAPNPKEINQHIMAFQHFMQTASRDELESTLSDLAQYEEDEVEFTRQMLEIGRQYNDDIYADIHDAGSIRKLKAKYSEKETELQKRIDKLEKQLNKYKEKYEDYDVRPGNMNLPTGSGSHNPPETSFDIGQIFAKPYQRNNRF